METKKGQNTTKVPQTAKCTAEQILFCRAIFAVQCGLGIIDNLKSAGPKMPCRTPLFCRAFSAVQNGQNVLITLTLNFAYGPPNRSKITPYLGVRL